ncbi:blue copper protein 1a-like [Humulus lupulus]|uniref:blue copper protein 1a-like n=1 Tax=Humulus lupulus TaxID=3486 RepID=UPI002B41621E|nr:blue copper protein 1a-like [Humulus lupulus]
MASSHIFLCIVLTIATIVVPSIADPTHYMVGDSDLWRPNVDYVAWAKNKTFKVGDTLWFVYAPENHDVYQVNGSSFGHCLAPPDEAEGFKCESQVRLRTPGNKWFLCSRPGHCAKGQKLMITVINTAQQPSPNNPSAAPPPNMYTFVGFFQFFVSLSLTIIIVLLIPLN